MSSICQSLAAAEAYRSTGASITIMTADGQVDGSRCDGLAQLPGVVAAGALRATSTPLRATVLSSAPLPVEESSPGFVHILGAPPRRAGVLVGAEAATSLGLTSSRSIATGTSTVPVGGVYPWPDDGRRPGLSYAVVSPVLPDRPYDECWVSVWPPTEEVISALLLTRTLSVAEAKPPSISQLNSRLGTGFHGDTLFAERITRFAGGVASLAGLALGVVATRARRLQFASALHAGVSRRASLAILLVETSLWCALSAALALPCIWLAAVALGKAPWEVFPAGIAAAAPAVLGTSAGAALAMAMTREQHLFRYFKVR
ncbi:hypothetical protein P5G50_00790 [Leifsonia sp. F6_8S_P_1B]|uniref:FtsX-like permease family protein n=1 Tax=Leifsonia williamsii TaxID=3035919 RepID=A0ABT8K723_9MICO|nr:hypothetical protein [Leifsonia williamsii]MDN4612972.1 hypothetical protein [Leifsonia williamsii]